jgi:GDP-4-dehydro-6-deoxy-D-mannose reductase
VKYLITGITGFAGPHLARLLLKKGHQVEGVVRTANGREQDLLDVLLSEEIEQIPFHCLDLKHYYSVQKLLNEQSYDGIFHLAAQSHPPTSFRDPILTFEENVNATVNLTTALEGMDTKIMVCSTSEVYGNSAGGQSTVQEDAALSPSNPYGASKAAIDLYMQERMANEKVIGFVTRAFSHTGPRRGRIFSISSDAYQIAKMMCGSDSRTLRVGNLNTERVVIDVRDCVNAYYLLMINELSSGHVYNVCGDVLRKMAFFTDQLIELSGLKIEKTIDQELYRPIDIQSQNGDSTRLRKLTSWTPEIEIEQTLSDLLDYWINKISINQNIMNIEYRI